MTKAMFEIEKEYISTGYNLVIGVDEAGRGPLAGPVVAAATIFKFHTELVSVSQRNIKKIPKQARNDKKFDLVRDSKLLSEKQREDLYDFIIENFYVGIGICDHKTIDRINILQATYLAMKKAITQVNLKLKTQRAKSQLKNKNLFRSLKRFIILVDGNKVIPNLSMEQKAIIGGDKIVKSISAASIIAKVTRDRIMREMHKKYPAYNFGQHKGYGTKLHREMIKKHGSCKIHRKSFKLV
jgi:ribonuclease HII